MAAATTAPSIIQVAFGDYDQELQLTRRALEAIPSDQLNYKPHDKSYSLGGLAQHIAQLPFLVAATVRQEELDYSKVPKQSPPTSTQDILALFDQSAGDARAAFAELKPEQLGQPWTFRVGDYVVFTMPKAASLRGFCISHMIHHRAQLTVYLRLLNVKVPGLYGPSADGA
jgi:uncharacterized damage-inducible protein DinB